MGLHSKRLSVRGASIRSNTHTHGGNGVLSYSAGTRETIALVRGLCSLLPKHWEQQVGHPRQDLGSLRLRLERDQGIEFAIDFSVRQTMVEFYVVPRAVSRYEAVRALAEQMRLDLDYRKCGRFSSLLEGPHVDAWIGP